MDAQTTLWLSISLPIAIVSLISSYFIFIKYKPLPRRRVLVGFCISIIVMGSIIGSIFINHILTAVLVGLLLPPLALWTWFMMQPSLRDWDNKRKDVLEKHKNKYKK